MSRLRFMLSTLLVVVSLSSCSAPEPATEVLVSVSSDLQVMSELRELLVEVYDRSGKTRVVSQTITLGASKAEEMFPLPLSYSLVPNRGVMDFLLVVSARVASGARVEQQAIGAFRPGERWWLPIYLRRDCLNQLCRGEGDPLGDSTCDCGACIPVPGDRLRPAGDGELGPDEGRDPYADAAPRESTMDAGPDASDADAGRDAADATLDVNVPDVNVPDVNVPDVNVPAVSLPDAYVEPGPCGTWVATNKDASPPANATSYGVEYNDTDPFTFRQYVCRVQVSAGVYVPGKGVFGYACYYIGLDNTTQLSSESFDVLVDTESCARLTPLSEALANSLVLLPTGNGPGAVPLYSCVASRNSIGVMPPMPVSSPTGRYDPQGQRCLFEWYNATQESTGPFSVLTRR